LVFNFLITFYILVINPLSSEELAKIFFPIITLVTVSMMCRNLNLI
jgi:hypothetical protein